MFKHEFFDQVFYNNTVENWIISLCYILGSVLIAKLLYSFSGKIIKRITAKTNYRLDDIIVDMLEEPLVAAVILGGFWAGLQHLNLPATADKVIVVIYKVLVVLNATWFVSRFVSSLISEYLIPLSEKDNSRLDEHVISLAQKVLGTIIWIFGVIMALNNAGVNVGALLAGLGIGGLAFALAAQDTVKNIFGGITIFTDKPFRIGDLVNIAGYTGTIEDIGMRSTRVRTVQGRLITIPNYKMADGNIENITLEPTRRIEISLGLTYDTTPDKMELALKILKEMPKHIPEIDSKILASFNNYGASSLDITCMYYILKDNDILETQSKVNLHILKLYNENGLDFAFPTQTVYLQK
jgi:MscS family membrane protein